MEPIKKARAILAEKYANVFILLENGDGQLEWEGSDIFGEGACRKFIREMTEPEDFIVMPEEDDEAGEA